MTHAPQARALFRFDVELPPDLSLADRGRRSTPARALSALLAVTLACSPAAARAAPTTDPAAAVRFTPGITATTGQAAPAGGVPVVNITTPNAQGISLNQYRAFVVDPVGVVLNNSNAGGGSFLGGQVGANPNLSRSGPASLIINQVTSRAPAQINGTVEIYGGAAALVIAAPGGVYTSGAAFTNTTDVTLSTGTPQWLTATGAPASFDAAAATGFLVEGGRVQIGNAYPGNPKAAGIDGTVANISLIGESVGIDAALYAGNRIDVIAGRQSVTPANGAFAVSPTGRNAAIGNAGAGSGPAIDASAFGAMTAGQIKLVSTASGLGVRADGNLAASAGNLTIDAAGNVKVGGTYAKDAVRIGAAGGVTTAGSGRGENGFAVRAGADVRLGGTLESGKAVGVSADGSIGGGGAVKARDAVTLTAGGSVDVAGALGGATIRIAAAGSDGAGDIRLGGDVSAPGAIDLAAARDTTIAGSVVSASDLRLSTRRNLTVDGMVGSIGGSVALTGEVGGVLAAGNLVSPAALTVSAGTDALLGGKVQANGPVDVTARGGSITTGGAIASNDDLTLHAARNVTVRGEARSARNATIAAGGGTASLNGPLVAGGDVGIAAGQDVTLRGSLTSGGDLTASAGRNVEVSDLAWVVGNATLNGADVRIGSAPGSSNVVNGTLSAAASGGIALAGDTQAGHVVLRGNTIANEGSTVAAQRLILNGAALSNTGMLAGDQVHVSMANLVNRGTLGGQTTEFTATTAIDNAYGLLVGAKALSITTGALASNHGGTLFAGDLTGRNATSGDLALNLTGGDGAFNNAAGQILAGNDLTVEAFNQTFDPAAITAGKVDANGTLAVTALAIRNTGTWHVAGGSAVLTAREGIANTGTILKAGGLSLLAGGALENSGQIIGGSDLSLSGGVLANTGVVHANGTLALNGNVANRGTAEALGHLAITGGDYDNRGGITQAGGDLTIDSRGTVNNVGSVIGASGSLHIAAGTLVNDRTAPVDAGSTIAKVIDESLLGSAVIGSYRPWLDGGSCDACTGPVEGPPRSITIADLMRSPDGSIRMVMGTERIYVGVEQSAADGYFWHLVPATANPLAVPDSFALGGVPTVDRTVVTHVDGLAGQIVAGANLDIAAASLSNVGGVISAGRDVTLTVGALDNGRSGTLINSVTDTVNQNEYAAFIAQLASYVNQRHGNIATGPLVYGLPPPRGDCDSCTGPPPWSAIALGTDAGGRPAAPPTMSTISHQLGKAGQITAGGDLGVNGTGDLINAGDLAAAGAVTIAMPGAFTNRGVYEARRTTTAGCVAAAPDCPDDSNPHVDSFAWQQTASTVAAGQTLTIQAAHIENRNATLAAQGDVRLTAGTSMLNAAGAIQSLLGDVSLDAPALVNKTMDPVKVHKSYGGTNPSYAGGCNPGGTYGNSQCAADEDMAAGPAAIISAARDVKLHGTTLSNNGALITGGRDVTVSMAAGVDNSSIALNADWVGRWQEKRAGGSRWHDTGGRTAIGSLESAIRAGNALAVDAGGQIINTGNLLGGSVDMSGAALINGYTSPTQPTPPSTAPRQVISLGPVAIPAGAVPAAAAATDRTKPWHFEPVIVAAPLTPGTGAPAIVDWHFNAGLGGSPIAAPGGTDGAHFLNLSPAMAVLAGITPNSLLAQLPPELRPSKVSFYYDPYTEGQRLQQAALPQTGQATFINGLAWDSQTGLSVTDQQKLILYGNAADYAKAHNIALGQALTAEQIGALDAPMLWYVEQAVPDPNCSAPASTACPLVNALVPQVYLPQGYAQALTKKTGGTIAGENVKVDIEGLLRNSGRIGARDTLTVRAGSIEAGPNVVDIGTSAYRTQGGWNVMTGTAVQPGGVMSAMHMDIEADAIRAVNDAFLVLDVDGSVNEAATLQLLDALKAKLGVNYTEGTGVDDIHTRFIKERTGLGPIGQIAMVVAAVAVSIVTAGAAAAAVAAAQAAAAEAGMATLITTGSVVRASAAGGLMASSVFATGGIANMAMTGALASVASSAVIQLGMTGKLDVKQLATAGIAGAVTGGLAGHFGSSYGVDRLLASAAAGCGTAAIQGDHCGPGAVTGFATAAVAWAGDAMRQDQIESSRRFGGIVDAKDSRAIPEVVSNATGASVGIDGDRFKLAGTRVSLDDLRKYGSINALPDGLLVFEGATVNRDSEETWKLTKALAKNGGLTGGVQGAAGTFAKLPYRPGTFVDKLLESFAGPHDYLGGLAAYDDLGNLKEGLNTFQRVLFEIQTVVDIPLAAPFAGVTLLDQYGLDWSAFRHQTEQTRRRN